MTSAQTKKIRKSLKAMVKEIKPGSKEAMAMLVATGIYQKDGKLSKAYR